MLNGNSCDIDNLTCRHKDRLKRGQGGAAGSRGKWTLADETGAGWCSAHQWIYGVDFEMLKNQYFFCRDPALGYNLNSLFE